MLAKKLALELPKRHLEAKDGLQENDLQLLRSMFVHHLKYSFAKDEYTATLRDSYNSLALSVRDALIDRWIETQQTYYRQDVMGLLPIHGISDWTHAGQCRIEFGLKR